MNRRPKVESIRNPTLFEMEKLDKAAEPTSQLKIDRPYSLPGILLGTSAFTAAGWEGSFYPKGMRSADYLAFYAKHFHTVEVDSTFYACPVLVRTTRWNPGLVRSVLPLPGQRTRVGAPARPR